MVEPLLLPPTSLPILVEEKEFKKKKLGWWEEMNAFYLLQICSPLALIILMCHFHLSACLHQEIRKVNQLTIL